VQTGPAALLLDGRPLTDTAGLGYQHR
jgi:hypothetical protein